MPKKEEGRQCKSTRRGINCGRRPGTPKPTTRDWYASIGINVARTYRSHSDHHSQQQMAATTPYHILQKPGETLYIPYGIVHSVLNVPNENDAQNDKKGGVTIAITKNYGSLANLDLVWKQVCESGDEKKWKILYNLVLNKQQRRHVRQLSWPFTTRCIKENDYDKNKRRRQRRRNKR